MLDPSRLLLDARHLDNNVQADNADEIRLTRPGQMRSCYEHLRRAFPRAHIDIYAPSSVTTTDDEDIAAIRKSDPRIFHRALRVPPGTDLGRTMLLHALSMGDGVIISNDPFTKYVEHGLTSAAWIVEKVWGFHLGRGDLVLPQLSPVHVPQEAHGVWRAKHERVDKQSLSTALRDQPDIKGASVQVAGKALKVGPREKLAVLQMQSELLGGELSTWVKVACISGEGWLKREHLKDIEGFAPLPVQRPLDAQDEVPIEIGQDVLHERTDKPGFLSALRKSPGRRALRLEGARAEPQEQVTVLAVETLVEDGETVSWIKVSTTSGAGWLKREHLRRATPAKRRRKGELWRCRLDSMPAEKGEEKAFMEQLKHLLSAYGMDFLDQANQKEVSVEGPRAKIAALRTGKLKMKVGDVVAQFVDAEPQEKMWDLRKVKVAAAPEAS